jgi:thiol-disulfide isomerase/thioredoxin|tara:strand:+ start:61 stop:657 length:597 start_codon:yes stop_codon:yes gene_type:complete
MEISRKSNLKKLAILIVIIVLLVSLVYYYNEITQRITSGKKEIHLLDPSLRQSVRAFKFETERAIKEVKDFTGNVVVVYVWASWCPPCVEGIPSLISLVKKFENIQVKFFGLSVDDDGWEDIRPFLKNHPDINYTIAIPYPKPDFQFETIVDLKPLGQVAALPTFFVIDQNGKLAGKFVGAGHLLDVEILINKLIERN